MQIKSLQLGDSPIRPAFYNTMDRKSRGFSSNKKVDRMSREKKNKSWSQISRYSWFLYVCIEECLSKVFLIVLANLIFMKKWNIQQKAEINKN